MIVICDGKFIVGADIESCGTDGPPWVDKSETFALCLCSAIGFLCVRKLAARLSFSWLLRSSDNQAIEGDSSVAR